MSCSSDVHLADAMAVPAAPRQPQKGSHPMCSAPRSCAHGTRRSPNVIRPLSGRLGTMTLMYGTQTIPSEVVDYLGRHHVITVSTPSFTGMPHADTVVYVSDPSAIYFPVLDETILARNIRDSKFVSFTIDDYTPEWSKLRELQGVGRATLVELHDQPAIEALFTTKFGPTFERLQGRLHALSPIEMHFVDYQQLQRDAAVAAPGATIAYHAAPTVPPLGSPRSDAQSLDRLLFEPGEMI